ncbi:MAG: PAS domain S-box protein [Candidatus Omnitrophica bacterium]|nr:PAS domain S-box protein [Candidatus Omnitrophota bacterium]
MKITIREKFLLLFLTIAIVPMCLFGYISSDRAISAIKAEVINNLVGMVNAKAAFISNYFREKTKDLEILAHSGVTSDAMAGLEATGKNAGFGSHEYMSVHKRLMGALKFYLEGSGFSEVLLISRDGTVVFTVEKGEDLGVNLKKSNENGSELSDIFNNCVGKRRVEISGMGYYPPAKGTAVFIMAPLVKGENVLGAVAVRLMHKDIVDVFEDKRGLGMTGEVLVAARKGNEAALLNPIRNDSQNLTGRMVPLDGDGEMPIQKAVKGGYGWGISRDYSGTEILAAWKYIPGLDWGLVVKIDKDEAFSVVFRLRKLFFALGWIISSMVALMAAILAGSISRPIQKLRRGTEIIGEGNLDYTIKTFSGDEIGDLSRAFNDMTRKLREITVTRDELTKEINERKRAEVDLRRLAGIVESSDDAIIGITLEGSVTDWNNGASVMYGYPSGEMTGESIYKLVSDDRKNEVRNILRQIHKGLRVEHFETKHVGKAGNSIDVSLSVSPIKNAKGDIVGASHIARDITRHKEAERSLRETAELKSAFTSMVSHELRTPLGPIREGASIILDGLTGEINESQRDLLETVRRNADRLRRLINDVLDYQKIGSGKMQFDLHDMDLNEIVREVRDTMVIMSNEKDLEFVMELDNGLVPVRMDRDRITQVVTNLVSNAIKFTEKGRITVSTRQEENLAHVTVSDTGPGIREEDFPKLFVSFQRLNTPKEREVKGTGLGLAISKEIIEKHRGKIWVESEYGKGAQFHFLIPIKERRIG